MNLLGGRHGGTPSPLLGGVLALGVALAASAGADAASVTGLRVGLHPDKTRLVLDMDGAGAFTVEPSADGRDLDIVLDDATWKAASTGKGKGLVDGFVYLGGATGEGRLMLALTAPGRVARAFVLDKPHRIVIDLEALPEGENMPETVAAEAPPTTVTEPAPVQQQVAAAAPPTAPTAPPKVDPHLLALDALLQPADRATPSWSDPDRAVHGRASNPCQAVKARSTNVEKDPEALFLWAECARAEGDLGQAAEYYRGVLALDPTAQRARLELADVLFRMREHDASSAQFAEVLKAEPPKAVAANVRARMAEVEMDRKGIDPPKDWTARVTGGVIYDTNVNGGPGNAQVTLYGTDFTLDDTSLSQGSWGYQWAAEGRLVVAESAEHKVDLAAGYSTNEYLQHGQYEVDSVYGRAAWQQKWGDAVVTLPLLASKAWVGGNAYSTNYTLTPEVRHPLNETLSAFASLPVGTTSYATSTTKDGTSVGGTGGVQLIIDDTWILRPSVFYTRYTAEDATETYASTGISAQLLAKLEGRWTVSGSAGYKHSKYREIDSTYGVERKDGTASFAAGVSWDMRDYVDGLALSLNHAYTKADSTIATYDYDRSLTSLSLSKTF